MLNYEVAPSKDIRPDKCCVSLLIIAILNATPTHDRHSEEGECLDTWPC